MLPAVYKKICTNEQQQNDRYQRNRQRQEIKQKASLNIIVTKSTESTVNELPTFSNIDKISCTISTQVSFDTDINTFTFECLFSKTSNDVGTQACIPVTHNNTFF